jgi:hypothetical protein
VSDVEDADCCAKDVRILRSLPGAPDGHWPANSVLDLALLCRIQKRAPDSEPRLKRKKFSRVSTLIEGALAGEGLRSGSMSS